MNYENYFKDLFESILDYRKIVLLLFLFKDDVDFLQECGFLKSDIERLTLEFSNLVLEQNEEFYSYVKNEEESVIEKIFNK